MITESINKKGLQVCNGNITHCYVWVCAVYMFHIDLEQLLLLIWTMFVASCFTNLIHVFEPIRNQHFSMIDILENQMLHSHNFVRMGRNWVKLATSAVSCICSSSLASKTKSKFASFMLIRFKKGQCTFNNMSIHCVIQANWQLQSVQMSCMICVTSLRHLKTREMEHFTGGQQRGRNSWMCHNEKCIVRPTIVKTYDCERGTFRSFSVFLPFVQH